MALPESLEMVRNKPHLYLMDVDYNSMVGVITGFDLACQFGFLVGFREWLLTKVDSGKNMAWPILVLRLAFPNADDPRQLLNTETKNSEAIEKLFVLLHEFRDERMKFDGLFKILKTAHEQLT